MITDLLGGQGNLIAISTPETAATFVKSEVEKYAKLVKKSGVKLD